MAQERIISSLEIFVTSCELLVVFTILQIWLCLVRALSIILNMQNYNEHYKTKIITCYSDLQ